MARLDVSGHPGEDGRVLDCTTGYSETEPSDLSRLRHTLWRLALNNKLYGAPIESWLSSRKDAAHRGHQRNDPRPVVLDVGSGDCQWAADFARQHPETIVYAVDVSQQQVPRDLPSNCIFVPVDFNQDWASAMPSFGELDYIHARDLGSSIPRLRSFIRSAYAALRPGGFFEMQDFDEPKKLGPGQSHCLDQIRWAIEDDLEENGISWYNVPRYRRCLEDAGFEPATETCELMPTTPSWPGNEATDRQRGMASLYQQMIQAGLLENQYQGCSQSAQAWSTDDLNRIMAGAKKEMLDNELKIAYQLKIVWGRKPLGKETSTSNRTGDEALSAEDVDVLRRMIRLLGSKL